MKARIIEFAIGILATVMIAAGLLLYAFREPERIAAAQVDQIFSDLDEAMTLYAENCSFCHGLAGEGIGATPSLDSAALRDADAQTLEKIIARGLFGTAMPAWHSEDGGPLSEYQIGEMVTLIQYGDWGAVQDRVVNLGLAPRVPFNAEPDPEVLAAVAELPGGESLAQGVSLYAEYCVACHGADGLGTGLAPALNDPSVRDKSAEELLRIVENGVSATLMPPWSGALTPEQIDSMIDLIVAWESVPIGAIPEPERPVPVTEESLALGEGLYAANCAHCHASEGQGTPRAPALNVKGFLESTVDAAIQQIITMGVPGTAMPAWGDRLADSEIQALVGFIRAWEPDAPEVTEQARGGGPWWSTGENGASSNGSRGPAWQRDSGNAAQGSENSTQGAGSAGGGAGSAGGSNGRSGGGAANGQTGGGLPSWAGGGSAAGGAAEAQAGAGDASTEAHSGGGPPAWAGSGAGAQGADASALDATETVTSTQSGDGPPAWAGGGGVQNAVESGVGVSETISSTHTGGGPPAWAGSGAGAQGADASALDATETVTSTQSGDGPPAWAGGGGVQDAVKSGVGVSKTITSTHTGGGPPSWAGSGTGNPDSADGGAHFSLAAVENATEEMDPRQVALFGALGGLTLVPVGVALIGLLRLRGKDQPVPL